MHRSHKGFDFMLVVACVLMSPGHARASVSVRLLADVYNNNEPIGVSEGGIYVCGFTQLTGGSGGPPRVVRWGPGGAEVPPLQTTGMTAQAISQDGSIIDGNANFAGGYQGFRWTEATGFTALPGPAGRPFSYIHGLTRDGSYVLGSSSTNTGGGVGTAWDGAGAPHLFPPAAGASYSSLAGAANDGTVFFGSSYTSSVERASKWSSEGTAPVLLDGLSGFSQSGAGQSSVDGSVVIGGVYNSGLDGLPVMWDAAGTVHALPLLSATNYGTTVGMSADGTMIAGLCWQVPNSGPLRPVVWINGNPINVRDLLVANGVPSSLASSLQVTSMSPDGFYLTAFTSSGSIAHAYLIQLPSPGPFALAAIAGTWLGCRRPPLRPRTRHSR
jgi:hypothetical protein